MQRLKWLTRRKKRLFGLMIIVSAFLLLGLYLGYLWVDAHELTLKRHARLLQPGMSLDQATAIWGPPVIVVDSIDPTWKTAVWDAWDGRMVVHFHDGRLDRRDTYPVDSLEW